MKTRKNKQTSKYKRLRKQFTKNQPPLENHANERLDKKDDPQAFFGKMLVGAGSLVGTIWKLGNEDNENQYCFDIRRNPYATSPCKEKMVPQDIGNIIDLTRVMTDVMLDDGCLSKEERTVLKDVRFHLELIRKSVGEQLTRVGGRPSYLAAFRCDRLGD